MLLGALATSHKVGILVVAGVFIAFALASSFLAPRIWPDFPGKHVRLFVGVSILVTAGMLATVLVLAKEPPEGGEKVANVSPKPESPAPPASTPSTTTTSAAAPTGDVAAGKAVFESAGCVSCHTLKAANATGKVGPNLDEKKPPASLVVERVTNGKGAMPSFKGQLSAKQIQDVAAFVSTSAGQG